MLVILPSPIPKLQHTPLPPKVLRAKERAPTPDSFAIFNFKLTFESIQEVGNASLREDKTINNHNTQKESCEGIVGIAKKRTMMKRPTLSTFYCLTLCRT
jgi:hypothetical protein